MPHLPLFRFSRATLGHPASRFEKPLPRQSHLGCLAGLGLSFAALSFVSAQAAPPIDPSGLWSTKDDESIIQIAPCQTLYCGTLVWLKEPNESNGKPKLDDQNKDPAKRTRPLIGIELLIDLTADKDRWRGTAYNSEDGKFYDITFKVTTTKVPNDTGEIEGCILKILCRTEIFTRTQAIPGQPTPPTPTGATAASAKQPAPAKPATPHPPTATH